MSTEDPTFLEAQWDALAAQQCNCDPSVKFLCPLHSLLPLGVKKMPVSETRCESATGGQKGRKLARFSLVPFDALWLIAELFGRGALKYADRNWEQGYPWSWSFDALHRHLALWWGGEEYDEETGARHIVCAAWHCFVLITFRIRGLGTDDRKGNV